MALNIGDPETDRLARELAALTGQPITTSVREALEARVAELRRRKAATAGPDLIGIIARGRARPVLDNRPEAAILGYDDTGMPA